MSRASGTAGGTAGGSAGARDAAERELAARVLDTVLREDYGGARRFLRRGADGGTVFEPPGHPPVRLTRGARGAEAGAGTGAEADWASPPGFLAEEVVVPGPSLGGVLAVVRELADPRDDTTAFERECRHALRARRAHDRVHGEVLARLATARRPGPGTYYETLAAFTEHPVHPAGRARVGMSTADLRRYGPEYAPRFLLRWVAVPSDRVAVTGSRPGWWPGPAEVGLDPGLAATHDLLPVHPLTARLLERQDRQDRSAGLAPGLAQGLTPGLSPVLAPAALVEAAPTLSVRTLAIGGEGAAGDTAERAPSEHLKLPLPVSTLGLRNRRLITPESLADGALMQRILRRIAGLEAAERGPGREPAVLLADEQTHGHAGHPQLGYLIRRFPAEVHGAEIVPVAALLARAPGGGLVVEELLESGHGTAGGAGGGNVESLFGAYLDALFGWNVALFVRYGIALEAHQQNVSLVLPPAARPGGPGPGLRLLLKDNDAALVDRDRLTGALGRRTGETIAFHDGRMVTRDPEALARVFVTITLHLCAGAIAFGLAGHGLLPLRTGLGLIRDRLDEALGRLGREAAFLRARTLDADRLPAKAMITAGTLVDKTRTGAKDINKHYGPPGPNYLRNHLCS